MLCHAQSALLANSHGAGMAMNRAPCCCRCCATSNRCLWSPQTPHSLRWSEWQQGSSRSRGWRSLCGSVCTQVGHRALRLLATVATLADGVMCSWTMEHLHADEKELSHNNSAIPWAGNG